MCERVWECVLWLLAKINLESLEFSLCNCIGASLCVSIDEGIPMELIDDPNRIYPVIFDAIHFAENFEDINIYIYFSKSMSMYPSVHGVYI